MDEISKNPSPVNRKIKNPGPEANLQHLLCLLPVTLCPPFSLVAPRRSFLPYAFSRLARPPVSPVSPYPHALALGPHWPFAGLLSGSIFCRWNFFTAILTIINKRAEPLCQLLLSRIPTGIGLVGFSFLHVDRNLHLVPD